MAKPIAQIAELETRILSIRAHSVLLDADLAALYGVTPSALMQAVRRNTERFPSDFMFQLTDQEVTNLKSQIVISSLASRHGGRRVRPYAFTEQGVAMLSSETAIQVNVEIMRAFVRLRRASLMSAELMKLVEDLSDRVDTHDRVISDLIESIRQLACPKRGRVLSDSRQTSRPSKNRRRMCLQFASTLRRTRRQPSDSCDVVTPCRIFISNQFDSEQAGP